MAKTAAITQIDFSGGMNTSIEVTGIAANQYAFLRNGRTRRLSVKPIKLPKLLTSVGLPSEGKRQGIYALGNYLLVFVAGKAYYLDLKLEELYFQEINNFQLDAEVDKIYAVAVPAGSGTFARKLIAEESIKKEVNLASPISGHQAAIVCQDGINQPFAIFADGSARRLQTYAEWTEEQREYVPIGRQMAVSDNILFIVAPDGRTILRSLRGRQLDFVIKIDSDGNKAGDAYTTSHTVGYNTITAISKVQGNPDIKLMVCSQTSTDIMTVRTDTDFFGEYAFANVTVLPTGAKNQESVFADLGDMMFIDQLGVRSFNATKQILTESNNDVFSNNVSNLFAVDEDKSLAQDITAVGSFANYIQFAVKTVYGYGVLIYDINTKAFVAFDQYPDVDSIKQFAEAKVGNTYRCFFLTSSGDIYEHYVGDVATVTFVPKGLTSDDAAKQINDIIFHAQFSNIVKSGIVQATALLDRAAYDLGPRNVVTSLQASAVDLFPLNTDKTNVPFPTTFNAKGKPAAFSVTCRYTWNFVGELLSSTISGNIVETNVSYPQKGSLLS